MPGKESGERPVVLTRIASLIIWVIIVTGILWVASGAWSRTPPPVYAQPTSTFPVEDPGLIGGQWVDVIVTAQDANAFDEFDVRDVVIRVSNSSFTDDGADGRLLVPACAAGESIFAWAPGYEVNSEKCDGLKKTYSISLTHLQAADNSYYMWSAASNDCNNCHGNQFEPDGATGATFDEMNEWFRSGHARIFEDRHFETMYRGTDTSGQISIPVQPVIIDNEWVPVPPASSHLYRGPGFRLDFPHQPGNCAYCHVPAAVQAQQGGVDLINVFTTPGGAWGEGVTCDVCHKVFEVILADDQHPFPDRPGVLSFRFLRPYNTVFITGPFSNFLTRPREGLNLAANHHSTCNPVFSRSEFCAPCHYGKFGDMLVYNSYGEWRQSPYAADPAGPGYRTCQDCHMSHMPVDDAGSVWSQRQACSASNIDFRNFDHNVMDVGPSVEDDQEVRIPRMVKGAARLEVSFDSPANGPNTLDVHVTVTNTKAGHKFPTDSPLRHLILVVRAMDRVDTALIQVAGDRIPNWAGPGPISPADIVHRMDQSGISDYAGLPGKIFANLLVEEETNLSPAMAYWNETKLAFADPSNGRSSDTRLVPRVPDVSTYSFEMPDEGNVRIVVELIYRFAFYDLAVWKEWFDRSDILVARMVCHGPPAQRDVLLQSCIQTPP